MEEQKPVRLIDANAPVLQAEVIEAGVRLLITSRGQEVANLLLTPEAFDDFCSEVMGMIYRD